MKKESFGSEIFRALEFLRKKLKVKKEKFLMALEDFGNTSSASIPLTMVNNIINYLEFIYGHAIVKKLSSFSDSNPIVML